VSSRQTQARIGKQVGAKVARSTQPAGSRTRSGTCSPQPNLRPQTRPRPWPP